jgi:hypothetical protein
MVFLERPIGASMLALAAPTIIVASLPVTYRKCEETFTE